MQPAVLLRHHTFFVPTVVRICRGRYERAELLCSLHVVIQRCKILYALFILDWALVCGFQPKLLIRVKHPFGRNQDIYIIYEVCKKRPLKTGGILDRQRSGCWARFLFFHVSQQIDTKDNNRKFGKLEKTLVTGKATLPLYSVRRYEKSNSATLRNLDPYDALLMCMS